LLDIHDKVTLNTQFCVTYDIYGLLA